LRQFQIKAPKFSAACARSIRTAFLWPSDGIRGFPPVALIECAAASPLFRRPDQLRGHFRAGLREFEQHRPQFGIGNLRSVCP
jgi:hypothetical protein